MWLLIVVLQMVWWLLLAGAAIAIAAVQVVALLVVGLVRVMWGIAQIVLASHEERRLNDYRPLPSSRPVRASAHSPSGSELWREYRETGGR